MSADYFADARVGRFFSKIAYPEDDNDCWLWKGRPSNVGYGQFRVSNTPPITVTAHRYMCELVVGEQLPTGFDGSHTCPNRLCVNPRHLVAETHDDNVARRDRPFGPHLCVLCQDWPTAKPAPLIACAGGPLLLNMRPIHATAKPGAAAYMRDWRRRRAGRDVTDVP